MRTTLDAMIAAGDLGLGVHGQSWQHCQFIEDLDYCSAAASACAAHLLAKSDTGLHVSASMARSAIRRSCWAACDCKHGQGRNEG